MEFVAVSDPQTIVDRQHHEPHIGQPLILGVLVRVVVGVVPAKEHLTRRTAVNENHCWLLGGAAGFLKELPVDRQTVAGVEYNFARDDEAVGRKVRLNPIEANPLWSSAG